MNHLSDAILIDLLAGHSPEADSDSVRRHLAECPACQQRLDELSLVHDLLDDADAPPEFEAVDLWPALKQRIEVESHTAEPQVIVRRHQSWWATGTTWRAAALIMLSIGIGHLTARITADSTTNTTTTTAATNTTATQTTTTVASAEDLVAADLYLDRFASPSALGLGDIVLTESSDASGEVTQ
ncbi:hypothetical protein HED60_01755 [Planctomycetales bacterium ZRK34]|nr:hypothetical protein HED60_01755 [Planctomycetales bacterium ZRK34]